MTTDIKATDIADGLRALAAMMEANPSLVESTEYPTLGSPLARPFARVLVSNISRDQIAALTRAALHAGAAVSKHQDDRWAGVDIHFGSVMLHVYTDREEVCEKVVTGVREVTKTIPDPVALAAVPLVEVTETVEDVEWICSPLLGGRPVELSVVA